MADSLKALCRDAGVFYYGLLVIVMLPSRCLIGSDFLTSFNAVFIQSLIGRTLVKSKIKNFSRILKLWKTLQRKIELWWQVTACLWNAKIQLVKLQKICNGFNRGLFHFFVHYNFCVIYKKIRVKFVCLAHGFHLK